MPFRKAAMLLVAANLLAAAACPREEARRAGPPPGPPAGNGEPAGPRADAARPAAVVLAPPGRPEARVTVEIARTEGQRTRGLMYRQHLPVDAGMVFLFEGDEDHVFWMRNTLIPLDMIFITSDLKVAGVVESAEPLTLTGRSVGRLSRYVLEVNGGWARAHGVGEGTPVRFENVR